MFKAFLTKGAVEARKRRGGFGKRKGKREKASVKIKIKQK